MNAIDLLKKDHQEVHQLFSEFMSADAEDFARREDIFQRIDRALLIHSDAEEEIFYQLLCEGGPSAKAAAFHIVFRSFLNGLPIESMVLVEASVFRGDHCMLEVGRDLVQRNEFVALAIRRLVNPRLQAALHVHRSCRWVDPPCRHQGQRRQRPKRHQADKQPSNKDSKEACLKWRLGVSFWRWNHRSE